MNINPGSIRQRANATITDSLLLGIIIIPITLFLFYNAKQYLIPFQIIAIIAVFLYEVIFVLKNNGQTIGKKYARVKIISLKGELTLKQLIVRFFVTQVFLSVASFIPSSISFPFKDHLSFIVFVFFVLFIVFHKQRRGIHDLAAGTIVVKSE